MNRRLMCMGWIVVVFAACGDVNSTTNSPDALDVPTDVIADGSEEEVLAPTGWAEGVTVIDLVASASQSGTIEDGDAIDMGWSHQPETYCFNVVEAQAYFSGPVSLFALSKPMPKLSTLTVTLVPASGVDVNLFAYQLGPTDFHLPPAMESIVGCQASYDASVVANPGVTETLSLNALNDAYNVVIGVAAPSGGTSGAFTLELQLDGGIPRP